MTGSRHTGPKRYGPPTRDFTGSPAAGDRTKVAVSVEIKPQGFAANVMLGVALRTMPGIEQQVIDGLEANLDSLAAELAKPDSEWDPAAWQPVGLASRS